jgi:hypothetical protein
LTDEARGAAVAGFASTTLSPAVSSPATTSTVSPTVSPTASSHHVSPYRLSCLWTPRVLRRRRVSTFVSTCFSTLVGARWVTRRPSTPPSRAGVVTHAALNMTEDSSFDEELAVPKDQRPVNELKSLQQAPLYSWVSAPYTSLPTGGDTTLSWAANLNAIIKTGLRLQHSKYAPRYTKPDIGR